MTQALNQSRKNLLVWDGKVMLYLNKQNVSQTTTHKYVRTNVVLGELHYIKLNSNNATVRMSKSDYGWF